MGSGEVEPGLSSFLRTIALQAPSALPAHLPDSGVVHRVSIVACAYNEASNVLAFLRGVLESVCEGFQIDEVIVVASGCTDATPELLVAAAQVDPRVKPVIQPARAGKAAALQAGFAAATGDIVFVENPDTVPSPHALAAIVKCFSNASTDVVCCHPVPVPGARNPAGALGSVLWSLHDEINKMAPKAGEGYAIRRSRSPFLKERFYDDDLLLTFLIRSGSLSACYCPDAIIHVNPPCTFRDYLRQRFRINLQVALSAASAKMLPPTWTPSVVIRASHEALKAGREQVWAVALFLVTELVLRGAAVVLAPLLGQRVIIWEPIQSTKRIIELQADP